MYKVMVTPPIVYVKVQDFLTSRGLAAMCDELRTQHDELDGNYDSIFIDLCEVFEIDFNFRNETRNFLNLIRLEKKHLVILNPPEKVVNLINKQGLSLLMKVKSLNMSALKPSGEFAGQNTSPVKAEELTVLFDDIAKKVFTSIGCDEKLLESPTPLLPPGEVLSLCEMVNENTSTMVGLKFKNKAIISGLINKMAKGTEIDDASLQRWTDEILNMFISQVATSQPNQIWHLVKVGQPAPASDPKLQNKSTDLQAFPLKAYSQLGIELVFSVGSKAATGDEEKSTGWVKNSSV